MNSSMVYDFSEHGLRYVGERPTETAFYLELEPFTVTLECTLKDGVVTGVDGYLPLVLAREASLSTDGCREGAVSVGALKEDDYVRGAAYGVEVWFPAIYRYFSDMQEAYDARKGIIRLGTPLEEGDSCVRVDADICCGLDGNGILKCLYIEPDEFVGRDAGR